MSEGSNINVGNIEEDIKIIKNSWLYNDEENVKFVNAIEHLLLDYTRQKQTNEEYQKQNAELMKAINTVEKEKGDWIEECKKLREYIFIAPNLDEMTAIKYASIQEEAYIRGKAEEQKRASQIIHENYISKQKIKDMFEESQTLYEKKLKEIDSKELKNISLNIFEGIKIEVERGLLRRLLQESEDK